MAINPKLLNEGEHVVVSTRTHPKALLGPIVVLLVLVFVVSFLAAQVQTHIGDDTWQTVLGAIVGGLAAIAFFLWVLRPVLSWLFTSYTFTDRRFIARSGVIAKEGRSIPLNRISEVDYEMSAVDRIFGCGTLKVSDASEQGTVALSDIPRVELVHKQIAAELHRLTGPSRAREEEDDDWAAARAHGPYDDRYDDGT